MGGTSFHRSEYADYSTTRAAAKRPVFAHTDDIAKGKVARAVHKDLDPKGVKLREARDSDAHPVSVPIAILLDVTGSMMQVPAIIEGKLPTLMGHFLEDKASGKRYLGDGYPAICVAAVDDYEALSGKDCLQVGQFESGLEIDHNIEKIFLTGNGGGTYEESYELGLYFFANHTAHDHMEKRGKKGFLFIIGDEHAYPLVRKNEVSQIIGDTLQHDIPTRDVIAKCQDLYHVFFIIPAMTNHYGDPKLKKDWMELLGQQNVLLLEKPDTICELIVATVAVCEEYAGVDDLVTDGIVSGDMATALVAVGSSASNLAKHSAAGLPDIAGTVGGTERL